MKKTITWKPQPKQSKGDRKLQGKLQSKENDKLKETLHTDRRINSLRRHNNKSKCLIAKNTASEYKKQTLSEQKRSRRIH